MFSIFIDLKQLFSCLKRIFIEKLRNPWISLWEYCSHFIIFMLLVLVYQRTHIISKDAVNYAQVLVNLPAYGLSSPLNSHLLQFNNIYQQINTLLNGPLSIPTFDEYIGLQTILVKQLKGLPVDKLLLTSYGQQFGNLVMSGSLHFAPAGDYVNSLIDYMNSTTITFKTMKYHIHESEDVAVNYILNSVDTDRTLALFVLREVTPTKVNYLIRLNHTTMINTNNLVNHFSIGLSTAYQKYFLSGFFTFQKIIDDWVFHYTNTINSNHPYDQCKSLPANAVFVPFPSPSYDANPFYLTIGLFLGLAISMSCVYPVSRVVKSIVEEKEMKMRELMKIMGLKTWVHQLSWFISTFILFLWIAITATLISKGSFLAHSDISLVFAFYFLYSLSLTTFCSLCSVFFSNAKIAGTVAPVALFILIIPRFVFINTNSDTAYQSKYWASLMSPTAVGFGSDILAQAEYSGQGIQYSNLFEGSYSFASCLGMLFVDFILYGLLSLYFDLVFPQEFGTPEHPLFFLNWRIWYEWMIEIRKYIFNDDSDISASENLKNLIITSKLMKYD